MSADDPTSPRPRWIGYALVLLAATLFGLNAGVSRVPMRAGLDTSLFTSVRITGALVVFVLLALAIDRTALRPPPWRQLPLIVGLGVVGVVGVQWTYNIAINRLPLGIALLLEYLGPVLVVLWVRWARHEPVSARMWPALGLTLAGLAVVAQIWSGLAFDGFGVVMALTAAVCFAAYFLLGEHPSVVAESPVHVIVWAFAAGTVIITVLRAPWSSHDWAASVPMLGRFSDIDVPVWTAMAWVIVFGTVVPFFVLLLALRLLPATVVSVTAMFEPVMATVVGWFWFGEALSAVQVVGLVTVLTGIVLAQTARIRPPTALPQPT